MSTPNKPLSHLLPTGSFPTFDTPDPRPGLIDAYTLKHLQPENDAISVAVTKAAEESIKADLPDISASPAQAKLLGLMAYSARAKHILEVGTLGGVSAIWLAMLNPEAKVTTVEFEEHHVDVARKNVEAAGLSERVEVIHGSGVDVLPELKKDIAAGKRDRINFSFIDADKVNNWLYFSLAVEISTPGAPIVVDNIVRRGELVDESKLDDEGVKGAREVVEKAGSDERVMGVVIQMVGEKSWDGQLVAVVK